MLSRRLFVFITEAPPFIDKQKIIPASKLYAFELKNAASHGHFSDCEGGGSAGIRKLMAAGDQTLFGASRETREHVDDKLRETVEQALAELRAATTPAEKAVAAERLHAAGSRLSHLVLCTSQLSEAIASFEAGPGKLSTK